MSDLDQDNSSTPPAEVGGSVRDLYRTSDIRFVMTEIAKLTERIDGLINSVNKTEGVVERRFDKIDDKLDKYEQRMRKLEDRVVYAAGALAMLTVIAAIIGFFFHSNLENIASAVAKLGK